MKPVPWNEHPRPLSRVKLLLVRPGKRRRRVLTGAFRGLSLEIDLQYQSQLYLGLHEREVYGFLRRVLPHVASAIDVGAAEGEYAIHFARSGARPVLAFEPDQDLVIVLRRNIQANQLPGDSVRIIKALAGASEADDRTTVDSVAANLPLPAILKIDVDGGEVDVLRGARRLLDTLQVLVLVETHSKQLEEECQTLLRDAGYETRVIRNATWRVLVPEYRPIEHNRWLVGAARLEHLL